MHPYTALSPHFCYAEMTISPVARLTSRNRGHGVQFEHNLRTLCALLEQVREHFAEENLRLPRGDWGTAPSPIVVVRAFVVPQLADALDMETSPGPDLRTGHLRGLSADFNVAWVPPDRVWTWLAQESRLEVGRLALEGFDSQGVPSWVHLDLPYDGVAGEVWVWKGGEYILKEKGSKAGKT